MLRTRLILSVPLPRRISGFTVVILPVILMNRRYTQRLRQPWAHWLDAQGRLSEAAACDTAQVLLHEAAHQLGAIWAEWKNWLQWLRLWRWAPWQRATAWLSPVYGADVNAADAISEAVCRELCAYTHYPDQTIRYRSPLAFLHPVFRRPPAGPG